MQQSTDSATEDLALRRLQWTYLSLCAKDIDKWKPYGSLDTAEYRGIVTTVTSSLI